MMESKAAPLTKFARTSGISQEQLENFETVVDQMIKSKESKLMKLFVHSEKTKAELESLRQTKRARI